MNRQSGRKGAVLTLRIPGPPVPKPRMTHKDKWEPSPSVQRYWAWADVARLVAKQSPGLVHDWLTDEPVIMSVWFYLPLPKSLSKAQRNQRLAMPHTLKPDLKNLIAGVEDSLQGALWANDSQIFRYGSCGKFWAGGDGLTLLKVRKANVQDARELAARWDHVAGPKCDQLAE